MSAPPDNPPRLSLSHSDSHSGFFGHREGAGERRREGERERERNRKKKKEADVEMGAEREGAREVEGVASERPGTPEYSQQAGRIRQAEDSGV